MSHVRQFRFVTPGSTRARSRQTGPYRLPTGTAPPPHLRNERVFHFTAACSLLAVPPSECVRAGSQRNPASEATQPLTAWHSQSSLLHRTGSCWNYSLMWVVVVTVAGMLSLRPTTVSTCIRVRSAVGGTFDFDICCLLSFLTWSCAVTRQSLVELVELCVGEKVSEVFLHIFTHSRPTFCVVSVVWIDVSPTHHAPRTRQLRAGRMSTTAVPFPSVVLPIATLVHLPLIRTS
jgi:hypothetical protein